MSEDDYRDTIKRYDERFKKYGYSPTTLGWTKGKQNIRFDILSSFFDIQGKTILDIGCGFGDLNIYLSNVHGLNFRYIGVDIAQDLIQEAEIINNNMNAKFMVGDFLKFEDIQDVDICISSGIFNHKFRKMDNYAFIRAIILKAFKISVEGVAFNFLSSKVDFRLAHTFHSEPEKILSYAYELTRNVILRNDYMPFEFSICLYKDDSFSKEDTLFKKI